MSRHPRKPRKSSGYQNTCRCACGCGRRTRHGICTYCNRGAHVLSAVEAAQVDYGNDMVVDRERTACTVCGREYPWSEFKPGDGRCRDCQP